MYPAAAGDKTLIEIIPDHKRSLSCTEAAIWFLFGLGYGFISGIGFRLGKWISCLRNAFPSFGEHFSLEMHSLGNED